MGVKRAGTPRKKSATRAAAKPSGRKSASPQNSRKTGRAVRDGKGRFVKGSRANPGGRPKAEHQVVELARQHTGLAVGVLVEIASNPEASERSRVAAATALLDRGWGRPPQAVQLSGVDGGPVEFTFRLGDA